MKTEDFRLIAALANWRREGFPPPQRRAAEVKRLRLVDKAQPQQYCRRMNETKQVDHRAEALRLLEWLGNPIETGGPGADPRSADVIAIATIHASLAIAEGQDRVAEAVERIAAALPTGEQATIGDVVTAGMNEIVYAFQMAASGIGSK